MRTKEEVINSFMKDTELKVNCVYKNGYEAGYRASETENRNGFDEGYVKGLEDAWECARRLALEKSQKDMHNNLSWYLFKKSSYAVLGEDSVFDAMKALEEYDKEQAEEVHAGDVVKDPNGHRAFVTNTDTHYHLYYPANGKTWKAPKTTKLTKTGTYIIGTYITGAEFHHE